MCFLIYLTVYCLQFSEICQIRYLDNKVSTCTKELQWGIEQTIHLCQPHALGCFLCPVGLSAYIFQVCATFLHFLCD